MGYLSAPIGTPVYRRIHAQYQEIASDFPRVTILSLFTAVPIGQLADRIIGFVQQRRADRQTVTTWRERNRHALREFWARAPSDALGVKRELEKAEQE